MSPGLAAMNDRVAAAGPFAKAAGLLDDLAGVHLTAKRVERSAEASGGCEGRRRPGPGRADHRPQAGPAAAVPAAGQAVRRDRRHRRAGDREGDRRPGRQGRGRPRPHPRGQARRLLHPGQGRRRRLPGPRPGLLQLPGHLRARQRLRRPRGGRGHPPRRRPRPPAHHPRRRRRLDLEHRHRQVPRSHPDRRPVPRPRAPARPRPASWSSCSATSARTGSPPAWRTWTTATSTASAPPPAPIPSWACKKDELDKALGYFENNAPRMRYKWFRSRGLFVGSGVVEAGCKAVVGQRLKLSGMRLDRRRRRRHHRPALPRGQQPAGNHLPRTAQPDRRRLTSPHPKMILITYKIDVHPGTSGTRPPP